MKRLPSIRSNTAVNVEVATERGVPMTLVRRAVARAADDEVDECWCVFDVEWPRNHPHLAEAMRLAEAHGVRLAVSNPCFELWLILHFEDQTAFVSTDEAERRSRGLDGRAGKRIDGDMYVRLRNDAVKRAIRLSRRHDENGTSFPRDNPSSSMHALLAAIEPAATRQ